jgi:magnesium-transporting ATPase (P-type)
MFSIIDNGIIALTQWAVTRAELYTPYTKKIAEPLLALVALMLTLLFIISGVVLWVLELIQRGYSPGIFWFIVTLCNMQYLQVLVVTLSRTIRTKRENSQVLPAERITRRFFRASLLFVALAYFLSDYVNIGLLDAFDLRLTGPFREVFFFEFMALPILLVLEYLVCTTSLPPGEKEKKKMERQMKNMTPVGDSA